MAKLSLTITITPAITKPSAPTGLVATPLGGATPSTAVTLAPAAPFTGSGGAFSAAAPVGSGVVVGTLSVAPAGWQGTLSLSGANASSFALNGASLTTAAALAAGTYTLDVVATP
jgi:hypothetical protein